MMANYSHHDIKCVIMTVKFLLINGNYQLRDKMKQQNFLNV